MCKCLQCYKCTGGDECGIHFSPNSNVTTRIQSQGNGFYDSCIVSLSIQQKKTVSNHHSPMCCKLFR